MTATTTISHNNTPSVQRRAAENEKREFLSFRLGSEEYGIDILCVQEIRDYETPTRMANVPAFIKGVINLRGSIVPIVDLRIKFDLGSAAYDAFTVVIILNVANRVIGVVVDAVSDVMTLAPEQILPAPTLTTSLDTQYVTGLGTIDERMLILVDIEQLMRSPGMGLIEPRIQ